MNFVVGFGLKHMKMRPPVIAAIYFLISFALNYALEIKIIASPYNILGIIPVLFGVFIAAFSFWLFKKKGTTYKLYGKTTVLVNEGPFRFSRNPIYLGFTLILFGIAVIMGVLLVFLAPLAFFLTINFYFIPMEEKKLEAIFGNAYLEYKKHVRRWV